MLKCSSCGVFNVNTPGYVSSESKLLGVNQIWIWS